MEISKLGALWSLMTGGWSGLAVYILEALNKWLAKLDRTKLAQAALVAKSVANAIDALAPLVPEKYADALKATTAAVSTLATALADGNVTKEELDANIDAIEAAIDAWKKVSKMKRLIITLLLSACCLCGCKQFYENAGVHVRTGSLTAPVEVSEPTSSVNLRALYTMDGIDMYAAKNCNVKMWYTNNYTNTYFGIVETRGLQTSNVEIEPTEVLPADEK